VDYAVHPARAAALREEIAHPAAGLIDGFDDIFQPEGLCVDARTLMNVDVGARWLIHAARSALTEARVRLDAGGKERERRGVIIGNLSYPSRGLTRYALAAWGATDVSEPAPDPRLRFVSALPARMLADAVGFGESLALDAACASSLYAIKYACDRLNGGDADLMLAGGLNATDVLCLHIGFTALTALSSKGRSRPFHPDADGLVPGQGAVLFALKRLADVSEDDVVHGIIRGVGLSNDGRGHGLLVPSREGQLQSLRRAYASSGVAPSEIDFVECHATGTATGDAVELDTLRTFFGREGTQPIGSLKGNLGHLLTAAGGAGLLKVLLAMDAGVLPASCEGTDHLAEDARRGGLEVMCAPSRRERFWLRRKQRPFDRRAPGIECQGSLLSPSCTAEAAYGGTPDGRRRPLGHSGGGFTHDRLVCVPVARTLPWASSRMHDDRLRCRRTGHTSSGPAASGASPAPLHEGRTRAGRGDAQAIAAREDRALRGHAMRC
jgi:3-oxoacyl-(acyl-carrier-protein) synthase